MTGLIKKQLLSTRTYSIVFILCSMAYIGMYIFIKEVLFNSLVKDTEFSRTALSTMPIIIVSEFCNKHFKNDIEVPGPEKYFNSLPVTRFQIVLSKFINSFLFTFLGLVMSSLCAICFTMSDDVDISLNIFKKLFFTFLMFVIFLTMQFPILIYNGNDLLSFFIPFTLIATPVIIICVAKNFGINGFFSWCTSFSDKYNLTIDKMIIIMLPIALLLIVISIYISYQIYKRREF